MSKKLHNDLMLIRAVTIWSRGHLAHPPDQSKVVVEHELSLPDANASNFPYKPLCAERNEIRLLRISDPPEVDGRVSCTLEHVSLDSNPVYLALSYCWANAQGDSSPSETLLIDGYPIAITQNLDLAIRNIFFGKAENLFWVDALCIHQIDVEERNSQVCKMKDIFENAECVIAWLGDEHDNSKFALQTLREILEKGVLAVFHDGKWNDDPGLEEDAHERASSVIMLLRRSYWARMWIVQEAALAKNLVLHCGTDTMEWNTMAGAILALRERVDFLLQVFIQKDIVPYMMILGLSENLFTFGIVDPRERQAPLGRLLVNNRYKLCTDPRDKVYGLLGLTAPKIQEKLAVSYDKSTAEVYIDATTMVIEQEMDFTVVLENKRPRAFDPTADMHYGLPTWVSNFHNKHGMENRGLISELSWAFEGASGTTDLVADVKVPILRVRGIRIGRISAVGDIMPEITFDFDFPPVIKTLYQWWLIYLSAGGKTILGDKDSFVNIIQCGAWYPWGLNGETETLKPKSRLPINTDDDIIELKKMLSREEEKTRYCLNIVMGIHKPDDHTLRPLLGPEIYTTDPKVIQQSESNIWLATMATTNRHFMTVGNRCGLAPMCAEKDDIIVVVLGCPVPIVLRERAASLGGGYLNIGDAYLHGIMDGEAATDLENGLRVAEDFEIR